LFGRRRRLTVFLHPSEKGKKPDLSIYLREQNWDGLDEEALWLHSCKFSGQSLLKKFQHVFPAFLFSEAERLFDVFTGFSKRMKFCGQIR
jgi:hypothetical protein